jgi:hypothetical protein
VVLVPGLKIAPAPLLFIRKIVFLLSNGFYCLMDFRLFKLNDYGPLLSNGF